MKAKLANFWRYRFLLSNLIGRDLKVKYRRSKLGVMWSVLNPLLMMLVMTTVFSKFFRMNIPNYPVYLLSGNLLFTFFNEATSSAMGSVLYSSALIKKVYVPKYIFPLEKSCFAFVNMLFSLVALVFIVVITRAPIHLSFIGVVIPLFFMFFFCLGIGLFLAAGAVYFRDIMHFWSVIVMALNYFTPIFYPVEIWEGSVMMYIGRLNPIYWYITTFRDCVINGLFPSATQIIVCGGFAAVALAIGAYVFGKSQDNFILHI
ncbi:MAG: ABC transporter permease [Oscillospiraceae bacterium]|nr:ABC transporter permease [Oscillospiraceae bacterium]